MLTDNYARVINKPVIGVHSRLSFKKEDEINASAIFKTK